MSPESRSSSETNPFPYVTFVILAAILAVAWFLTGFVPTAESLEGVAWSRQAWQAGDWMALWLSLFAHGGLIHLMVNAFTLASFGPIVEREIGHARFAILYLGAGLAGNFVHAHYRPDIPVVGASGALFGLIGLLIILVPSAPVKVFGILPVPILLAGAAYVALVPFLIGLSDVLPIAHEAHLAGMTVGLLSSFFIDFTRSLFVFPAAYWVYLWSFFLVGELLVYPWSQGFSPLAGMTGMRVFLFFVLIALGFTYLNWMDRHLSNVRCLACRKQFTVWRRNNTPTPTQCLHCKNSILLPHQSAQE